MHLTTNKEINRVTPKILISDCDGVISSHNFYYSADGKVMKKYSADDNDALSLIKPHLEHVIFVTGDKRGFEITKRRVEDMKCEIELVSTIRRIDWIKERFDPKEVVYIGDGIFDHYVFREVGYSISTSDAFVGTKEYADYVTTRRGGDRAFAEACLHLLEKFYKPYNTEKLPEENINESRDWTV